MQLRVGRSYTGYYATEAEAIVFVLVASEPRPVSSRTRFWFPVVGEVAYKSFFDRAGARERRARARRATATTRGSARATAYSTLGFFRDPVTTVMMRKGDGRLRRGAAARDGARAAVRARSDRLERAARELRRQCAARSSTCARATARDRGADGRARPPPRAARTNRGGDRARPLTSSRRCMRAACRAARCCAQRAAACSRACRASWPRSRPKPSRGS